MSNPENDSRLEQLSREAADRYTVKASSSWDKMEKELDKVLPTEKKKRRFFFFWWVVPGILIIGSILWYTLHIQQSNSTDIGFTIVATTPNKESIIESPKKIALKKEIIASVPSLSNNKQKNKHIIDTKHKEALLYLGKKTQHRNSVIVENTGLSNQPKNSEQAFSPLSSVQKNIIATTISTSSASTETIEVIRLTIDTGNNVTDNSIHTVKDSMYTSLNFEEQPNTVKSQDSMLGKNKKEKNAFSWALVAGIDATTVKLRYADKASLSGGIMIGYHFNKNWSVHTGGLYTRKNYKIAGSDFKAPTGTWVANYKLETVDGYCNMWEVPLLLRYTFNAISKTKVFVSSGLSSYFMTRENYNYFYYYNGLPVRRNANYPDGKTHLFSILKLSAGLIRDTNNSAALAVEPFANLPLGGLGFGSVRLSSFGINVSYQFRQPNKKK
ncbi:MAG: hypothetical protein IBJ16_14295 [Chitinophagaceae bacterium]|nr:hypothetical protein [Chitinophagaceae bacterium]